MLSTRGEAAVSPETPHTLPPSWHGGARSSSSRQAARIPVSPLILSDRLITLAQDADRAGFTGAAEKLVNLACAVLDEAPRPAH
jgi:hypothetical protein